MFSARVTVMASWKVWGSCDIGSWSMCWASVALVVLISGLEPQQWLRAMYLPGSPLVTLSDGS
jgi:hypothetical protein